MLLKLMVAIHLRIIRSCTASLSCSKSFFYWTLSLDESYIWLDECYMAKEFGSTTIKVRYSFSENGHYGIPNSTTLFQLVLGFLFCCCCCECS